MSTCISIDEIIDDFPDLTEADIRFIDQLIEVATRLSSSNPDHDKPLRMLNSSSRVRFPVLTAS